MAGSRLEKFGTIYNRVSGLLRAGALKQVDRPLWYDIYSKFPPAVAPLYERAEPTEKINPILYPEDIIRLEFYKCYGNPDVVNLNNESVKTTCQKFVEKYIELSQSESPPSNPFTATVEALKESGIRLRHIKEIREAQKEEVKPDIKEEPRNSPNISVAEIFGELPSKSDYLDESKFIDLSERRTQPVDLEDDEDK